LNFLLCCVLIFTIGLSLPTFADQLPSGSTDATPRVESVATLTEDVGRFSSCMKTARVESKNETTWISECGKCHANGRAPTFGMFENCRQMIPSWCLFQKCRPQSCKQAEPSCNIRGPNDIGRPTVRQPPGRPAATTPTRPPSNASPTAPANSTGQPTAATPTGDQNADTQSCDQLARRANQCCNNPASCMTNSAASSGPAPGQGLNEYCQQMRALGQSGGQSNNSASGTCYQAYNRCATSCDGMASGYSGQVAQTLRDTANGCRMLQSRVSQLASQGLDSQASGSAADLCNSVSQAAPQNAGGGGGNPSSANNALPASSSSNPNDPYGCGADPSSAACQQCSSNPNTPACRALAYEKEVRGEATFGASENQAKEKTDGSGFDIKDSPSDGAGLGLTAGAMEPTAIKTGTIANNAGGGIPGGGGGSPASLGGGGGGRGSPGSPGYTTDVLQGLSSPSGYSASAEPNPDGAEGGFQGYGQNGRAPATDQNGVDLRRFLPGGDKDPMRRGVGGIDINSAQINGRSVNLWNRISDRMQEKCRLGELIGCER